MREVAAARRTPVPDAREMPRGPGRETRRSLVAIVLLSLLLALTASPSLAISPGLDGFGIYNGGSVAISGSVHAIAQQRQDGKIVIGGDFTLAGAAQTRRNIARINPDGTLDTSFVPPLLDGPVHALALQPDPVSSANPDLVLIGGGFTTAGATSRKGVARLSGGDGSLDPGFDPVTTPAPVSVNAMLLLPGGSGILVGGTFAEIKAGVATRNLAGVSVAGAASGELSWSYLGGLGNDAGNVAVHALALQDGSVLVGGEFATPWSANIARFSASGEYDAGFRPPAPGGGVRALAVQEDRYILVGGDFSGGLLARDYLARLKEDGTRDDGFDAGFIQAAGARVSSLLPQPDGKILVAGEFAVGPPLAQRRNLARLNLDGSLSAVTFPPADGAIRALARQGDGKILAGGDFANIGAAPRTSLARFYPEQGALDDDLPQLVDDPWEMVVRASLGTDGSTYLAGTFTTLMGNAAPYNARLKQDWSLDHSFGPLELEQRVFSIAQLPDRGMLLAGEFLTVNGVPQRELVQVDRAGVPGPASFNTAVDSRLNAGWGWISALVQPADGTLAEDGMFYVGGYSDAVSTWRYLSRFKGSGERDESFVPPAELDGVVTFLAIQRGNLLLVGTDTGKVLRLLPDGSLDPAWNGGTPVQFPGEVDTLLELPDGGILVAGNLKYPGSVTDPVTGLPVPLWRNLVRLGSDGAVDEGFVFESRSSNPVYPSLITNVTLQADGGMLVYGIFDRLYDGFGTVLDRSCLARVTAEGRLDPSLDLAIPVPGWGPGGLVNSVTLQPDGKMLVAGDFVGVGGRNKLARFANGWSSEELSVSPAGDTVTWLRSGSAPELWRVSFDYSENPDAAAPVWIPLGQAHRIPGGWQLDRLDLPSLGTDVNRYLRARGVVAGEAGSAGDLVESVRLYRLRPRKVTVTVTAHAKEKIYGAADPPLTYSFAPPLNGADRISGELSRVSGENVGSHAITRGTLALGSGYDLVFNGASLTITQAPLLVKADDQAKTAGFANPPLTATFSGLAPWDSAASLGGAPLITTAVDAATPRGSYPIHAELGNITSANYRYSFADGSFTVAGRPQSITFAQPPPKVYGAPPFAAGGSAGSGLPVSYVSSNPAAAVVVGGEIRITGAGSTVITASQGGDGFWDPAPEVPVTLAVAKAPLRVVAEDKSRAYLTPNPELTAAYLGFVNGEGNSVLTGAPALATLASLSSPAGSYSIVAGAGTLQAANYQLVPVNGTLTVYRSCQEITFPAIPERTFGDPPFQIVASACSGLPLGFRSSNPDVARVDGDVITITGAGSAVITASQGGGGDLETAPEKSQPFVVHRNGQQVSFTSPAQKVVGDPPFDLEGSASSGLPLSYRSSDPAVATVEGSTVTVVGAGTTVISALQEGSGNYLPALPVSRTLAVAQEGTPPQLSLSTLNAGASTANPVLNIMGSAADVSGIASLRVAGSERSADAALFSSAVMLADGENSIVVTARDGAGNATTHTFSVTLDALAPVLAVSVPADNSVTDAVSCAVTGTAPPGSTVSMAVNGAALQLLQVGGGGFTGSALLAEGVNTIELNAELDGRSARVKRSVTFNPAAPALSVNDPVQDLRTEAESVTIRGTAGSAAAGRVQIEAGGAVFAPEVAAGLFQQQLPLALGENRITVRASSADGTTSVAHRNLVRIGLIGGDLDGNGSVDIRDALQLLRISLGAEPATAAALAHGDLAPLVNGVPRPDGVIDVGDLLVLLRRIVGVLHF
ncbi:hypothetical protein KOM00_13040 [Geomonas sp. Red69]|uniref:MBG domain-containing protein n=1 Tax=Geomonas diazotrophica TaxID=2843197 RepID=UPI001C0F4056|nr:MBG domain-containing protein [Geomonas diazotrophica]MBU5637654.1 hypothetical protein [Geomonas diazotrophica]